MSMHLIELNDYNVSLHSQDSGLLVASPGFAVVTQEQPLFGEDAKACYRLHPRQSFNQFWSQLSMDPLVNSNKLFRHQADLAYGHLKTLAQSGGESGEVVFVIPGNYTRNQLAVLLGLAKQTPLKAVGLVDLSVLATAPVADSDSVVYLDMQLHQSVLSVLVNKSGQLQRQSVLQIPGTGLLSLQDAWAGMITDAFIRQSRFDPLHNAETEQFIYNQLPIWIAQSLSGNEVLLEINHKGSIYQAKINRGHFELRAKNILTRIKNELKVLTPPGAAVLTTPEVAQLPGMSVYLPEVEALDAGAVVSHGFGALDQIVRGGDQALSFITSLTARKTSAAAPVNSHKGRPSHLLVGHTAHALGAHILYVGKAESPIPSTGEVKYIEVEGPAPGQVLTLSRQEDGGYTLEPQGNSGLLVNGEEVDSRQNLKLGDLISPRDQSFSAQLIQVQ